ncbi:MAG: outer membrane protein assembly factor BamD [Bacteroidia bacterium]
MFKKIASVLLLCAVMFSLVSCSKYQRLLKSGDYEAKYKAAVDYYNKKDYYRSLQLLEELIALYRGTAKGEDVYYYYAKSNYGIGDYVTAAYHFETFTKTFPSSTRAEECAYLNAYCYYLDSPISSLDQENTMQAIQQFQLFANHYPQSEKVADCNKLMDELRFKLETKEFDNAKLFYNTEDYKSAITALNNVIRDYPGTGYKEECLFLILKSSYLYARKSIDEKKLERYKAVIESYNALKEAFPDTKYLKEANDFYANSQSGIKSLTLSGQNQTSTTN